MKVRFFKCAHCGKIVFLYDKGDIPTVCCGETMKELVPNTADGAREKHVPVVRKGNMVVEITVGSTPHPMLEEHHIEWVYLETENGGQIRFFKPGDEPSVLFAVHKDEAVCAYAYCNLHGLWAGL